MDNTCPISTQATDHCEPTPNEMLSIFLERHLSAQTEIVRCLKELTARPADHTSTSYSDDTTNAIDASAVEVPKPPTRCSSPSSDQKALGRIFKRQVEPMKQKLKAVVLGQLLSNRNSFQLSADLAETPQTMYDDFERQESQAMSVIANFDIAEDVLFDFDKLWKLSSPSFGRLKVLHFVQPVGRDVKSSPGLGDLVLIAKGKQNDPDVSPSRNILLEILPERRSLPYQTILLVWSLLVGDCATFLPAHSDFFPEFVKQFSLSFVEPWAAVAPAGPQYINDRVQVHTHEHETNFFTMWYAIRYFRCSGSSADDFSAATGLALCREVTTLPSLRGASSSTTRLCDRETSIHETRDVVFIKYRFNCAPPTFSIVLMTDEGSRLHANEDSSKEHSDIRKSRHSALASMFVYLSFLSRHSKWAVEQWGAVLARLEGEIELRLSQVADDIYMSSIMFDHGGLDRSKFYFRMLQLLRIMQDAVEDSKQRLHDWPQQWKLPFSRHLLGSVCEQADLEQLFVEWDKIASTYARDLTGLQQRISKKQAEIESLRDGLFNATAVREALLARNTNQNIMVFTVVTIVFLPLSFVTSFFGMDTVLDAIVNTNHLSLFAVMLVALSLGTYAVAFGSLDWYRFRKSGTSTSGTAFSSCANALKTLRKAHHHTRSTVGDIEEQDVTEVDSDGLSTLGRTSRAVGSSTVAGRQSCRASQTSLPSNASRSGAIDLITTASRSRSSSAQTRQGSNEPI